MFNAAPPENPYAPSAPPAQALVPEATTGLLPFDDMAGKYRRMQRNYKGGGGRGHVRRAGHRYQHYSSLDRREEEQPPTEKEKAVDPSSLAPLPFRLCRAVLSRPWLRINAYALLVAASAVVGQHELSHWKDSVPTAAEDNPVNKYMVKLSWGWTLGIFAPLSLFGGLGLDGGWGFLRALVRCGVDTVVWFGVTNLFDVVRKNFLHHFDTSGHCFLLAWCSLVLIEESGSYACWDACEAASSPSSAALLPQPPPDVPSPSPSPSLLRVLRWPARLCLALSSALVLVWDVMFASTALFYHTWQEKAVALAAAVATWVVVYGVVFAKLKPRGLWRPETLSRRALAALSQA